MQYSNKQDIMTLRSAVKVAVAVVTVLLMLPVLGDFPMLRSIWLPVFFVWIAIVLFAYCGGIDEIYVSAGHGYVEILRAKFVTTSSHRTVLISTKAENIRKVKYRRLGMMRRLDITYREPKDNEERQVKIGLTMVDRSKRRELFRTLSEMCRSNLKENK
ncbi:MAG: hypothetical protein MJZ15_08135 [Bacteroidales bacterium]|nr:hypothetical protein [Bacteroidales bacterium]